jgi:hypothetical protein
VKIYLPTKLPQQEINQQNGSNVEDVLAHENYSLSILLTK